MIGPHWYAAFLLLASGGLGLLVYAVADLINHEWATAYLWPLLAAGAGLVPVLALLAYGWRWWEREGAQIDNDRARAWALNTETERKQAELAQAAQAGGAEVKAAPLELWAEPLRRFFRAGDRLGFGVRALAPNIVSGPDWGKLTAFYCSEPGWAVLQCRGGQAMTEWAEGWTLAAVLAEIDAGRFPCPAFAPLEVHVLVVDTTQTQRKHTKERKRTAGSAIVEGVIARGD